MIARAGTQMLVFARLDAAAVFLAHAQGWRRLAYAGLAGALAALAFPPFLIFPLLLLGYAALVLLLDGAASGAHKRRDAALIGWAFGFGHFLIGLHWVGYAFLVDAKDHAWQLPFVLLLFPGGLALFFALAALLCVSLWREGAARIYVFAAIVAVVEYARGHVLTGFPWNLPGYGWGASTAILQSTAIIGIYGLSVLTLLFGASLALLTDTPTHRRTPRVPLILALGFVALWAGGVLRLAYAGHEMVPNVRLRIVQPDTPQSEKYDPIYIERNWRRLVDLTRAPAEKPITHVIWPEAAPPFLLQREPQAQADITALNANARVLLTGAVRYDGDIQQRRFYNSFFVIGRDGRPVSTFDKFHLVPFGEYLPLESVLHALGITQLTGGDSGFLSGPGPRTMAVPGAPDAGVLICYEIIFPAHVAGAMRPAWFVNVTDDSWFGPGAGPEQHFLIARVRAIEEGIPIARSANSGISGVIDSFGRVVSSLDLNTRGVLDSNLPVVLNPPVYVLFGDVLPAVLVLVLFVLGLMPRRTPYT